MENFKSNLFFIPVAVQKIVKDKPVDILLHSSYGTGKSTIAKEMLAFFKPKGYIPTFFESHISLGKDEIQEHLERIQCISEKSLTVIDEMTSLTPAGQAILKSFISKNTEHKFIFITNSLNDVDKAILDRIVLIDCNIPIPNDIFDIDETFYQYLETNNPELLKDFKDKEHFIRLFNKNFSGSIRNIISLIKSKQIFQDINISDDILDMVDYKTPLEIQRYVYDKIKNSMEYDKFYKLADLVYKMNLSEFKKPFLSAMLTLIK